MGRRKRAPEMPVRPRDGLMKVQFQPPGGEMGPPVYLKLLDMQGSILPKNRTMKYIVALLNKMLDKTLARRIEISE